MDLGGSYGASINSSAIFFFPVFSIGLACYSEHGYLIPPKVSYEEDEEEGLQE